MRTALCVIALVLASLPAVAQGPEADAAFRSRINAFVDEWHDDAAHSRLRYFDKIAPNGVYIGTDKSERWTRDEFKAWAKPHFDRPTAWAFRALHRNVAFSADKTYVWFDEQLDTQMGVCQASGVIRMTSDGPRIEHYQLSVAIPNDLVDRVSKEIREFEAKPAAK
jgi:hypothetical protein